MGISQPMKQSCGLSIIFTIFRLFSFSFWFSLCSHMIFSTVFVVVFVCVCAFFRFCLYNFPRVFSFLQWHSSVALLCECFLDRVSSSSRRLRRFFFFLFVLFVCFTLCPFNTFLLPFTLNGYGKLLVPSIHAFGFTQVCWFCFALGFKFVLFFVSLIKQITLTHGFTYCMLRIVLFC